jgi:hypothetical protein
VLRVRPFDPNTTPRDVLERQAALHAKLAQSPPHQHVDALFCLPGKKPCQPTMPRARWRHGDV